MIKIATALVLGALALGASAPAHAQTTVHTLWSVEFGETFQLLSVDPDARRILGNSPWATDDEISDPYITPDGALMVARGRGARSFPGFLALRDLSTGSVSSLPIPFNPRYFFGHPTRPEVYMGDSLGIVALSASGFRRVSSPKCSEGEFFSHASMSPDGRRLAIACLVGDPLRGAVVDTESGAEIATFTGASEYVNITLSRDGQEFYALTVAPNATTWLRRYSVSTETVLAEVYFPLPRSPFSSLQLDPRTGRLYLQFNPDDVLRVYDPVTLQELGTFPAASGASRLAFDPHRARAYRAVSERLLPFGGAEYFSILDTDALAVLFTAQLGVHLKEFPPAAVVVAPRPGAPTGLAATVAGSSVQLSWAPGPPPGTALRYVLEAGSAPGLANLASFDVGLQTSLTVNAVPPGTYYVRVRPANVTGSGQPSNEIVVTVP